MDYVTTKEECESKIHGVCEGCGGELSAIETVDNADHPTFWVGCEHCSCFRSGIEPKYFKIARKLVSDGTIIPYQHMNRHEHTPENLEYYLECQTAGLSPIIKHIEFLLKEEHDQK